MVFNLLKKLHLSPHHAYLIFDLKFIFLDIRGKKKKKKRQNIQSRLNYRNPFPPFWVETLLS